MSFSPVHAFGDRGIFFDFSFLFSIVAVCQFACGILRGTGTNGASI